QQSGRAYAVAVAVDGDGKADSRISNPKQMVDDYEANRLTPDQRALREKLILTFYVDRAPFFQTWQPAFTPKVTAPYTTYTTRVITGLNWATYSDDNDPYDPSSRNPGGPPPNTTPVKKFFYTVTLRGPTATSPDTVYSPPQPGYYRTDVPPTTITVPNFF